METLPPPAPPSPDMEPATEAAKNHTRRNWIIAAATGVALLALGLTINDASKGTATRVANPAAQQFMMDMWDSDVSNGYYGDTCSDVRSMSPSEFHDSFMAGPGREFAGDIDRSELYDYFARQCDLMGL